LGNDWSSFWHQRISANFDCLNNRSIQEFNSPPVFLQKEMLHHAVADEIFMEQHKLIFNQYFQPSRSENSRMTDYF